MAEDEQWPGQGGEDLMLRDAIDALRRGDRTRARDLLTRLLKVDQKNANYWVWLSAAVETQKERIYCLERALQADPQNMAAKRGLTLFGVIPLDESVKPFPLDRPRLWEEKFKIPLESGERISGWANPGVRLASILGISLLLIGGLFLGRSILFNRETARIKAYTPTHRPTITSTFTPSFTPIFRTATPTFMGPTPLWLFLASTYTPTPLYVFTQHPIISRSAFEAGLRFLGAGDYANALVLFRQALSLDGDMPDLYYYLGETYRGMGDYRTARENYQEAIDVNESFAPAYLGRARANLGLNPRTNVSEDLDRAISLDPQFVEAYLARADYLADSDPSKARSDVEAALEVDPDSALVYLTLAEVQLLQGEGDAALESARHANELDMTLVAAYYAMGRAYFATGQVQEAISVLKTYVIYMPEDQRALYTLGKAENVAGEYEAAVEVLDRVIEIDDRDAEAYFQRGFAYLNLVNPDPAENDFESALRYNPQDFDSALGLARVYFLQEKPGNAYVQAHQEAYPLSSSNETRAQVYYWEAVFQEAIGDEVSLRGAQQNWANLIALPADAMPLAWRLEAYRQLDVTPTFTPTSTPTRTPTRTPTATATRTLEKTPTPKATP